jgi:hypothetical protein
MNAHIFLNSCKKLLSTIMVILSLGITSSALANTYTVTNVNDGGTDSLRQAMLDANANLGVDNINFNIPGTGPFTIALLTPLPTIIDPVEINGYSQPGATVATSLSPAQLKIILEGSSIPSSIPANGLEINTHHCVVKGLVIHSFLGKNASPPTTLSPTKGAGIYLYPGSQSNKISGNYIGLDVTGSLNKSNGFAAIWGNGSGPTQIYVDDVSYTIVGGPNIADRNVISQTRTALATDPVSHVLAPFGMGVFFDFSSKNIIQGNYLGTNAEGTKAIGNFIGATEGILFIGAQIPDGNEKNENIAMNNLISGFGVGILTYFNNGHNIFKNNLIGTDFTGQSLITNPSGTKTFGNGATGLRINLSNHNIAEGNIIGGSATSSVLTLSNGATGNIITNNAIGSDKTGTISLQGGNVPGIFITGSVAAGGFPHDNMIMNNTIAFNALNGITVIASPLIIGNSILSNSIHDNGRLGIDLGNNGPSLNDNSDTDVGPNNLQNFPLINAEKSFYNPALIQVWGSLDSQPNRSYKIQAFSNKLADPSGYGEGHIFIGEKIVTTDANGHVDFHFPAMLNTPVGDIITATATDLVTNDTSEFSPWEDVDIKGSPTAFENANGAADGDAEIISE